MKHERRMAMRKMYAIFPIVLAGVLLVPVVAGNVFAQTTTDQLKRQAVPPPVEAGPAPVVIGSAIPQGSSFVIVFDEKPLAATYPEYSRLAGRATPYTPDEVRNAVQATALRKLSEVFPKGVPPDLAGRIKITVNIKFSRPPEVAISVQW
jgi:hypothetical protein